MQRRLALSLSGGGARAFCYFGVIRALEHNNIKVDYIAAHSGAAILLCYLYSGLNDEQIISEFSKFNLLKFLSLNPLANRGFINIKKLINFLRRYTKGRDIKDMPVKTFISTSDITDFDKPFEVWNSCGDLAKLAVISAIVPPIFPLYRENKKLYADGGYTSLYSVKNLKKEGADIVIGLYPDALRYTKLYSFTSDFAHMMKSLMSAREYYEKKEYPVDLEIKGFPIKAGLYDYKKAKLMYKAGYKRTIQLLPKIRSLIK